MTGDPDDADWPDRCAITEAGAIALLTDLRALRMLHPFLARSQTLTGAARAANRPVSSLAYWVPRFVGAGLLVRLGEVRRNGPSMPIYRTPARNLIVPFEAIPFDARARMLDSSRLQLFRSFADGLDEAMARSGGFGLRFASYGDDGSIIDIDETDGDRSRRPYTEGWRTLELGADDARSFSRELEELVQKYVDRRGPRTYVCHVGLAPEPTVRWRSAVDPR